MKFLLIVIIKWGYIKATKHFWLLFWKYFDSIFNNVNPVSWKWQHGILLTSSFMLENFPSHSASPRDLESFLAFMTWWVIYHVVISSSQDWYIVMALFCKKSFIHVYILCYIRFVYHLDYYFMTFIKKGSWSSAVCK